jgi:1-acyl-sn-glycerol-3-phosphate acyltransferase
VGLRLLPGVTLRFYAGMLHCVLCARRQAAAGRFTNEALAAVSEQVARYVEGCGGRLEVAGLEQLQATPGAAVFIGNHMSSLETFLIPGIVTRVKPLAFVVKDKLLTHPLFGAVMRALPAIPVTRSNPRQDLQTVLEQGAELLRRGLSLCIFPQATRSVAFVPESFNTLGVKLARRAGVPVIPVALRTDFWGNGRGPFKDVGPIRAAAPIRFALGAPLPPDLPQGELQQRVVGFITGHLREWGVPIAASAAAAPPPEPRQR